MRRRQPYDDHIVAGRHGDNRSPTGRRAAGTQPLHRRHIPHYSTVPLRQTTPSVGVASHRQRRNDRGHVLPVHARWHLRLAHRRRHVRFRRRMTSSAPRSRDRAAAQRRFDRSLSRVAKWGLWLRDSMPGWLTVFNFRAFWRSTLSARVRKSPKLKNDRFASLASNPWISVTILGTLS